LNSFSKEDTSCLDDLCISEFLGLANSYEITETNWIYQNRYCLSNQTQDICLHIQF